MTEDKELEVIDLLESGEEVTCVIRLGDDVLYVDLVMDDVCGDLTSEDLEIVLFRSLVLQDTAKVFELLTGSGTISLDTL